MLLKSFLTEGSAYKPHPIAGRDISSNVSNPVAFLTELYKSHRKKKDNKNYWHWSRIEAQVIESFICELHALALRT